MIQPYSFESARWHPAMRGSTLAGMGQTPAQISGQVGGALMSIVPATGPGAPFVAAAAGVAQLVSAAFSLFSGCGQTCVQTSNYANQAEALLNQIKQQYFATPTPRPQSFQASTLASIQQIFTWLKQMCSQPSMGTAGQNCISQRLVQGAPAPWCPNPGNTGCDWVTNYYVPIENDPNVVPDASLASASITVSGSPSYVPLLLIAAAVMGVVLLL